LRIASLEVPAAGANDFSLIPQVPQKRDAPPAFIVTLPNYLSIQVTRKKKFVKVFYEISEKALKSLIRERKAVFQSSF
jgi:hypothetical protein